MALKETHKGNKTIVRHVPDEEHPEGKIPHPFDGTGLLHAVWDREIIIGMLDSAYGCHPLFETFKPEFHWSREKIEKEADRIMADENERNKWIQGWMRYADSCTCPECGQWRG